MTNRTPEDEAYDDHATERYHNEEVERLLQTTDLVEEAKALVENLITYTETKMDLMDRGKDSFPFSFVEYQLWVEFHALALTHQKEFEDHDTSFKHLGFCVHENDTYTIQPCKKLELKAKRLMGSVSPNG